MTASRPKQTDQDAKDFVTLMIDIGVLKSDVKAVQAAVVEVGKEVKGQETLKPKDLESFKDYMKELVLGIRSELQKQIDENDSSTREALKGKADKSQVDDLRGVVKWAAGFFTTVLAALVVFYITKG